MLRLNRLDIILEIIDLCQTLEEQISEQLNYYRASVYKSEQASQIEAKIKQLQLITSLFEDSELDDAFADYEVSRSDLAQFLPAGECTLTYRIHMLFSQINRRLDILKQDWQTSERKLSKKIQQNRRLFQKISEQGPSRSRIFSHL